MSAFAKAGIRVFSYDRKGYGKSEGVKGRADSYVLQDCLAFIDHVVKERSLEDAKKFIYGVSMGGLLATRAAIERPDYFAGVILTVPWIDSWEQHNIGAFKKCLGFAIGTVFPRFVVDTRTP